MKPGAQEDAHAGLASARGVQRPQRGVAAQLRRGQEPKGKAGVRQARNARKGPVGLTHVRAASCAFCGSARSLSDAALSDSSSPCALAARALK